MNEQAFENKIYEILNHYGLLTEVEIFMLIKKLLKKDDADRFKYFDINRQGVILDSMYQKKRITFDIIRGERYWRITGDYV